MRKTVPFYQGDLTAHQSQEARKGICLRLAWKWAACQSVGGDFKFSRANAEKSAEKQIKSVTKPGILNALRRMVTGYSVSEQAIAGWSKEFTTADKTKHSVLPGLESKKQQIANIPDIPLDKPEGMVLIFEGEKDAHAVALYGGEKPRFFDPNSGEDEFQNLREVRDHILSNYPWAKSFSTVPLSGEKDLQRQQDELLQKRQQRPLESDEYAKLGRLQNQLHHLAGRNNELSDDRALRAFKRVGQIVKEGGKWSFFCGVAITAIGAGLCLTPAAPAGIALIAGGVTCMKISGATYLAGKITYPTTKLILSMQQGLQSFKEELKKCAMNALTSTMKIGGALAMSAATIALLPAAGIAAAGAAPALIATGSANMAAAGLVLPAYAGIATFVAAGGIAVWGGLTSLAGSIFKRKLDSSRMSRRSQRPRPHRLLQPSRTQSQAWNTPNQNYNRAHQPAFVSAPSFSSSYAASKGQVVPGPTPLVYTQRESIFAKEDKQPLGKAKKSRPPLVKLSRLTAEGLRSLQNHMFIVESAGSRHTVIHKDSTRFRERIACTTGIDCPAGLQAGDKMKLNISNGVVRFERALVKTASLHSRSLK